MEYGEVLVVSLPKNRKKKKVFANFNVLHQHD
jgi:hypothetical protein